MTAVYWRKSRRRLVFGARRRYWFLLGLVVGYQMLFTPFEIAWRWGV